MGQQSEVLSSAHHAISKAYATCLVRVINKNSSTKLNAAPLSLFTSCRTAFALTSESLCPLDSALGSRMGTSCMYRVLTPSISSDEGSYLLLPAADFGLKTALPSGVRVPLFCMRGVLVSS